MSGLVIKSLSASEIEFLAEETIVTVTSSVDHPKFKFLSGDFGPLIAGLPCQLPLWLAITLRKKGKCKIEMPEWMSVTSLEEFIKHEKSESMFYPLPFHYIEISQLLITYAKEDVIMVDKVSSLLQDLESIRMDRARLGLLDIADRVRSGRSMKSIGLPNISCAEIQTLKPVFLESMEVFRKLTESPEEATALPRVETVNTNTSFESPYVNNTTANNLRRFKRN
jgi:GINS complex subunit 2